MRTTLDGNRALSSVVRSGWRWMRRVYEAQLRSTHSELNAVAVVERRGAGDALVVNQRAVEASQVNEHVLTVASLNLSVAARDDCGCGLNRYLHSGLASEARHIFG